MCQNPFSSLCLFRMSMHFALLSARLHILPCLVLFPLRPCHTSMSFPTQQHWALNKRIMVFGAEPSSGKWNIALRTALSGHKVCVRKAVTGCCVFIMRTVDQTAPAAVNRCKKKESPTWKLKLSTNGLRQGGTSNERGGRGGTLNPLTSVTLRCVGQMMFPRQPAKHWMHSKI